MLDRWAFYLRHSFNDLRVNGKRTLFALLCIAAGVAAIVSLQTLAVMIGDTLTGNLQESNRGDLQFRAGNEFEVDEEALQLGVEAGVLDKNVISFFGSRNAYYQISGDGLVTLRDWLEKNYPGQARFTYRQPLSHPLNVLFGSGAGASMTAVETGETASSINPIVVESAVYPFYSVVESVSGKSLADMLQAPTDVVLSRRVAGQLSAKVGTVLRISGSSAEFTVRGIVENRSEVKNPGADFLNALYGFYYLDVSAMALFDDIEKVAEVGYIALSDVTPAKVEALQEAFETEFPYFQTKTTENLRADYRKFANAVTQLVSLMGLISLLIGCIGIINTMQVIVRRRMMEVAVLKTIGLTANQVTVLFLVEAFIMGVLGSILGILLGWLAVFAIKGGAETLLATPLSVTLVPSAALSGFVVGVLVTTVFGILPTLAAGRVRPSVVLRPSDAVVPRAGLLRRLLSLIVLIFVLALVAQSILGSFLLALGVIAGAFFAAGFLYVILFFAVWVLGTLFPSFGIAELKVGLRQLVAGRARAAATMLALVIGVFSLSLITLFSETMTNILEVSMGEASGGNVAITVPGQQQLPQVREILDGQAGVRSYKLLQSYSVEFQGLDELVEGSNQTTRVSLEQLAERMGADGQGQMFGPGGKSMDEITLLGNLLQRVDALQLVEIPQKQMASGRRLRADDEGRPVIVLVENPLFEDAGIDVGDRLVFRYVRGDEAVGEEFALEVTGIERASMIQSGFAAPAHSLRSSFPEDRPPDNITIMVDIEDESVPELRRSLLAVPGIFVLETAAITRLITSMLDTFTAFPLIVAALGLVVGGIVIANSVALSTMERRREIAVLKALGLQRERVLFMLLLEHAIMGVIAGGLGVGIGLFGLLALSAVGGIPLDVIPFGTAFLLMGLCVLVALIATMATAWGASGEKPLNVLRYE